MPLIQQTRHHQYNSERPVFITGLSGAGMSSCMKTLEDLGFEVFDNFPLTLVDALLTEATENQSSIAVGIDSRSRGFSADCFLKIAEKHNAYIIFLTCDDNVLLQRFTETRRRHPLGDDMPVRDAIEKEHELLDAIRQQAAITIDTSELSVHDLRHILKAHFGIEGTKTLRLTLMSFGFKYGPPRQADIVMDVRFLQNPHWVKELRPCTGFDAKVGEYVSQDIAYDSFITNYKNLLETLIPRYAEEGKSYLTIATGCTGGRHRSVFVTETLKNWLEDKGYHPLIDHRDVEK